MSTVRRLDLGPLRVPTGLLLWGPFAVGALLWACHSPDDAFITLRYARNLVHGHGPTFDPGARVEGFSSPLHLLVDAIVVLVPGGATLAKAKVASFAFAILAVAASGRLLRRAGLGPAAEAAGLVLVGGSWILGLQAATGIETSLATFLLTALLASLLGDGAAHPWRPGLLAAGCVAVRPEGALLVIAVALGLALAARGTAGRWRWAAFPAATAALLVAARLATYGELLPNTYFAKRQPTGQAIGPGLRYLVGAASPWVDQGGARGAMGMAVATLAALALAAGAVVAWRSRRPLLPALAAVIAQVVVAVVAGGDWVAGARFLAPVVPAIVVLQVAGVEGMARRLARAGAPRWASIAGGAALGALVVAAVATAATQPRLPLWHSGWAFDDRSLTVAGGYDGTYWAAAPELFTCARPGDLVAYSEMGYVAWTLRDLRFLDLHGLVDREIGHADDVGRSPFGVGEPDWWGHPTGPVAREVLRRRPALLVIGNPEGQTSVLDGRYRAATSLDSGSGTVTAFVRSDRRCPAPQD